MIEKHELYKRLLKYVMMLLIIYLSVMSVGRDKLCHSEIFMITMLATTGYVFTDLYYPSIVIERDK
jgi:hypothetical protein